MPPNNGSYTCSAPDCVTPEAISLTSFGNRLTGTSSNPSGNTPLSRNDNFVSATALSTSWDYRVSSNGLNDSYMAAVRAGEHRDLDLRPGFDAVVPTARDNLVQGHPGSGASRISKTPGYAAERLRTFEPNYSSTPRDKHGKRMNFVLTNAPLVDPMTQSYCTSPTGVLSPIPFDFDGETHSNSTPSPQIINVQQGSETVGGPGTTRSVQAGEMDPRSVPSKRSAIDSSFDRHYSFAQAFTSAGNPESAHHRSSQSQTMHRQDSTESWPYDSRDNTVFDDLAFNPNVRRLSPLKLNFS